MLSYTLVPRRDSPKMRLIIKTTRKMKNRILAIPVAALAITPKPNSAAMIAITRNTRAPMQHDVSSYISKRDDIPAAQRIGIGLRL